MIPRSSLLGPLVLLAGCTEPLELPVLAQAGRPVVRSIVPDTAFVSPETSAETWVCVEGEALTSVYEVRVGEFVLPNTAFRVLDDSMLELHVPENVVTAVRGRRGLGETEGRRRTVQVRGAGGESSASDALRLFDGPAGVESVTPRSAAPGQAVFLRGRGFDAETLFNNAIMLVGSPDQLPGALSATASLGDQSAAVSSDFAELAEASQAAAEAGFAVAQTLLATSTTLVVMLPPAAPAGDISFEYMNLGLGKVAGATACARRKGAGSTEDRGTVDPRLGVVSADQKSLRVWRALTSLEVRPSPLGPDAVEVEAPERLCYLDGAGSIVGDLRVFLDGGAVSHAPSDAPRVTCRLEARTRLILSGVEPGRHLLQVANPFGLSPTVGFER